MKKIFHLVGRTKTKLLFFILFSIAIRATAQNITGTGTVNYIPIFTNATIVGSSSIYQGSGSDANLIYTDGPLSISDNCTASSIAMLYLYRSIFVLDCKEEEGTQLSPNYMAVQGQTGDYHDPTTLDYFRIVNAGEVGVGIGAPVTQFRCAGN